MFLICDTRPVRKDNGRLNPTHQPTNRAAVPQSLQGRLGGGRGGPGVRVEREGCRTREPAAALGPHAAVLGPGGPFPWGSVSVGKGGSSPISFTLLETELRKHQAWGLRVPCRLDKPQRWIWQPGQWKGNLPWVLDRSEGHRDRLPVGAARPAPASRGHLLRAGSSLCLVVGSICSCTESRGEGGEQREKAQLVDEQRETCRKSSPQNTRNH